MCNEALEVDPLHLYDVPGYLKTQEMCDDAVGGDSYSLQFVPDSFATEQQIKIWDDDDKYCNDNELNGYKKRKAHKARIKEELLPIAWHPSRWWDCCIP